MAGLQIVTYVGSLVVSDVKRTKEFYHFEHSGDT